MLKPIILIPNVQRTPKNTRLSGFTIQGIYITKNVFQLINVLRLARVFFV